MLIREWSVSARPMELSGCLRTLRRHERGVEPLDKDAEHVQRRADRARPDHPQLLGREVENALDLLSRLWSEVAQPMGGLDRGPEKQHAYLFEFIEVFDTPDPPGHTATGDLYHARCTQR